MGPHHHSWNEDGFWRTASRSPVQAGENQKPNCPRAICEEFVEEVQGRCLSRRKLEPNPWKRGSYLASIRPGATSPQTTLGYQPPDYSGHFSRRGHGMEDKQRPTWVSQKPSAALACAAKMLQVSTTSVVEENTPSKPRQLDRLYHDIAGSVAQGRLGLGCATRTGWK